MQPENYYPKFSIHFGENIVAMQAEIELAK